MNSNGNGGDSWTDFTNFGKLSVAMDDKQHPKFENWKRMYHILLAIAKLIVKATDMQKRFVKGKKFWSRFWSVFSVF